ncbi:MAG: transposase, partial [Firmicutes bacterium]|nr:transposase [Bacillota bacterium]
MAQVNITLSEEEIKRVLLGDRNESLRFRLEKVLNEVMKAESEEQIGAAKHERSEERSD